ncbi:MAG: hypothetical protein K2X02_00135 [Alphaproteobacteria bacterium]|nr:hypothetical protein [Alphaproteobacteria bacterium]
MKKVRGLVLFLSLGSAVVADVPDEGEIQSSRLPSRPDDDAIKLISSTALESITPEGDTPMRPDEASPGADQRVLDSSYMEKVKVVYPEKQPSWWECVYNYLFCD